MVFDLVVAQEKVNTRLFDNIGTTVVLSAYTQTSTNDYGDELASYAVASSIVAVPYSLISKNNNYQPFGDMQEGDMDIVFKYNQTINLKDRITVFGTNYLVKSVEDFPIANGLLAKVARITKAL